MIDHLVLILTVIFTSIFSYSGYLKIRHDPSMLELFNKIGPIYEFTETQFCEYIGLMEILGCFLLIIPHLTSFGSTILCLIMLGAIAVHIFVLHDSWLKPAIFFLGLLFITIVKW